MTAGNALWKTFSDQTKTHFRAKKRQLCGDFRPFNVDVERGFYIYVDLLLILREGF